MAREFNALPLELRAEENYNVFKRKLKAKNSGFSNVFLINEMETPVTNFSFLSYTM